MMMMTIPNIQRTCNDVLVSVLYTLLALSYLILKINHSWVQPFSHLWHFATPWTAAHQASLSMTNSGSLLKLMFIELVMTSNHLILCRPLLLPPSIFPNIRVFSTESVIHIKWPKYWSWSFSFSTSPSNEYSGLTSFRMDLLDLLEVQGIHFMASVTICSDLGPPPK